jgi:hypothetical protein
MIDDLGAPLANTTRRAATTTWRIIFATEHIRPALSKGRSLRQHRDTSERPRRGQFSRQRNRDVNFDDDDKPKHCIARRDTGSLFWITREVVRSNARISAKVSAIFQVCLERPKRSKSSGLSFQWLIRAASTDSLRVLCEAPRAARGG